MSGTVENNKMVNVTAGVARVTAIVADLGADGKTYAGMSIFSCVIGSPDSGIAYPINTVLPQNNDMNDIYSRGAFLGTTLGNETLQETTVSMSFINDFVYKLSNGQVGSNFMSNVLVNLLKGEAFKDGGKVYKVYGTNGVKKTGKSATVVANLSKLFKVDGMFTVPQAFDEVTGKPLTVANTRVTAYNNKSICVMIEHLTAFDSTNKQGLRYVYTMASNFTMTENDDVNKISFDAMFLSDAKNTESFFIDGFGAGEADVVATTGADAIYKVNADYIVPNYSKYSTGTIGIDTSGVVTGDGTTFINEMVGGKLVCEGVTYTVTKYTSATSIKVEPSPSVAVTAGKSYVIYYEKATPVAPTFSGSIGKIAVAVSPVNGKAYLYKHSGSAWVASTSTMGEGCAITSAIKGTDIETLPATVARSFVFIGTAGVSGSAVAIAEKSATPTYVWDVKDFDYATQTFVTYTN